MERAVTFSIALVAMVWAGLGQSTAQVRSLRDGPSISDVAQQDTLAIASIRFRGAKAFSEGTLSDAVKANIRAPVTRKRLQAISDSVTQLYVDNGYFLSKAVIKPQSFENGIVYLDIVEGYLSGVEINGAADHPLTSYFTTALSERPLKRQTFERAVTLINGLPGHRITGRKLDIATADAGAHFLSLEVKRQRVRAQIDATNKGVREGEAWRALAGIELVSVLRPGDRLGAGALTRPGAPSELAYFVARYSMPIGASGARVFADGVFSDTSPQSALVGRDLEGTLRSFGIGAEYPIIQRRNETLNISTRFDWINSRELENDSLLYEDRLRVIRAEAQYAKKLSDTSRTVFEVRASQGLPSLNASTTVGEFTSRPDADAEFFKIDGSAAVQTYISDRISLTGSAIGQYTDDTLLFLEEFALGGGSFGRAYDFGEVLGEQGVAGFVEAGYHGKTNGPIKRWELYSYADVGAVWNAGAGFSVDGDPLYSAGGGFRVNLFNNVTLNYEAAYPLADAPFTEDDDSLRHRLQIGVSYP
ncbi:MAG: ShlB/FhaC/HecB family hemolysin secretion/activation protein [Pseudomonadota bacterium]